MTKKYALLLAHQGSASSRRLVAAARSCGLTPVVISNAPPTLQARAEFEKGCREADAEARIFEKPRLTEADCLEVIGQRANEFAFALALWDGQRALMARMNEILAAPDQSEVTVQSIQDKLRFRQLLGVHGLTWLHALTAQEFLTSGKAHTEPGPWIVKPRRGLGSVCTRVARSEADVREILALFTAGSTADDIFSEVYKDNELIVEDYFEGQEFSLDLLMQAGRCIFVCDHEKVAMAATSQTILELAFASPSITLSQSVIDGARELTARCFEVMGLHSGWFHVELRVNAAGQFEFIEINLRTGGGLIPESLRRQSGRTPVVEWCQLLQGIALTPNHERRCGIYMQVAYAQDSRPIKALLHSALGRPPDMLQELKKVGDVCQMDREDLVALTLWETSLEQHLEEVATLASVEFTKVITEGNVEQLAS